jgi:hypothetical protein
MQINQQIKLVKVDAYYIDDYTRVIEGVRTFPVVDSMSRSVNGMFK